MRRKNGKFTQTGLSIAFITFLAPIAACGERSEVLIAEDEAVSAVTHSSVGPRLCPDEEGGLGCVKTSSEGVTFETFAMWRLHREKKTNPETSITVQSIPEHNGWKEHEFEEFIPDTWYAFEMPDR